eukprot:16222014-Heterocapsa_arctica.AAC.1
MQTPTLASAIENLNKTQELMMQQFMSMNLSGGAGVLNSDDPVLGNLGLGAVKSARERELYQSRIETNPESIYNEWWKAARMEAG